MTSASPQHASAFIGGALTSEKGARLELVNPANETSIGQVECNTPETVKWAVSNALEVFQNRIWSAAPLSKRAGVLRAIAQTIRDNAEELAALDTLCAGLPYHRRTLRHAAGAAGWFDYFADFLSTQRDDAYLGTPDRTTLVTRVPRGVVALYAPWNVPLGIAAIKLAAALAAGNTCVIKPSEQTPLSMLRLAALMVEAGLPAGCVNVVNGRGPGAGAALAKQAPIAAISFTGGAAAGASIAEAAAGRFIPVTMELGGKSPTLIFADSDYEAALDGALLSAFSNSGQACLAGSRILVEASIADRFIADFTARTKAIRIAEPMDPACEMGPMSSENHRALVARMFEEAVKDGAEPLTACKAPEAHPNGFYLTPGILHVTDPKAMIFQTEVFGPLATLMTFRDDGEALSLAQDSSYGLAAYVWTRDIQRALQFSKALDAGTILVNTAFQRELNAPFGGFKASGIGREGGGSSYAFYTQEKTILLSDASASSAPLGKLK